MTTWNIEVVDDKNDIFDIAVYKVMWYSWYNYNIELYVTNTAVLWYKSKKDKIIRQYLTENNQFFYF